MCAPERIDYTNYNEALNAATKVINDAMAKISM